MAITHKFSSNRNLAKYQTWISDTDPFSRYFQLSQVPEVLTAGKNAFLINGSPELVSQTEVLVELIDSNGQAVFVHPIRNYIEGLARVVTIEIYEDTPPGLATLTIMGQLKQDADGVLPPDDFQAAYNVKWQRRVMISPTLGNQTTVRLLHYPSASVTELLNPYREASQSVQLLTGSTALSMSGATLQNAIFSGDPLANSYIIILSSGSFTKAFEGGELRVAIGGTAYTSSITKVVNSTMAMIEPSLTSGTIYQPFTTNIFSVYYTGSLAYTLTEFTRSYADLSVNRLSTFTGDIYKVKVFVTSIDSPGNPESITEVRVEPPEMLVTSSYMSGKQKLRTGYFTDDSVPTNYWVIGTFETNPDKYNP